MQDLDNLYYAAICWLQARYCTQPWSMMFGTHVFESIHVRSTCADVLSGKASVPRGSFISVTFNLSDLFH